MKPAQADPYLDKLDDAVLRQLESQGATQRFVVGNPTTGNETVIDVNFSNGTGVPRSRTTSANRFAKVDIPRRFLLRSVGWMDALALSDANSDVRARLPDYQAAFVPTDLTVPVPFWKRIGQEPEQAGETRRTMDYSTSFQKKFLSTVLLIEAHEFSHIILDHRRSASSILLEQEAEADGASVVFFRAIVNLLPEEAERQLRTIRDGMPALFTLTNDAYVDPGYPPLACRIRRLAGSEFDDVVLGTEDCAIYGAAFERGEEQMRGLIESGLSMQ
ncbi:hypothetical protein [Amaricoccus sp. W119]|uniref:hypothetical protein n=1 Tax=Amaricoccus sp. W119 TaxID=3391833 RepID=UPI0039A76D08